MDWRRGKSILIISFLILNILLAGRLYFIPEIEMYLSLAGRPSLEAIFHALQTHGIATDREWPRSATRMPFTQVSLRRLALGEIMALRRSLLGDEAVPNTEQAMPTDDKPLSFTTEQRDLVVTARGHVSFHNRAAQPSAAGISAEEAVRIAETFFKTELGNPGDFVFDSVTALDNASYRVEYVQTFRGHRVFPGYIIFIVPGQEVAAMWMSRLNVAFEAGGAKAVLSAAEAVLSLLNHRLNARVEGQMEIVDIEFGYHSPIYDVVDPSWRGVPVWRIRTKDGVFFINAHSGVLES